VRLIGFPNRPSKPLPFALQGISVASLPNPDKDGYLTKQGGNIKTWKKRWCVLKDGSIFYFKTPKVRALAGAWLLLGFVWRAGLIFIQIIHAGPIAQGFNRSREEL
jgi:hypothetical protein